MNMSKLNAALVVAAVTALSAPLAHAVSYPADVLGDWEVVGNRSEGTLSITSQTASSGSKCRAIAGTVLGHDLQGFYCPSTGDIHFVRKLSSGVTIQTWTGRVSETGRLLRMGGVFTSVDLPSGGFLGTYNFSAQK